MWRILLIPIFMVVAGCAQIPPSPQEIQAKKFESVPGKAVIYIVRTALDSQEASGLLLGESGQITTLPGTFYRWEVAPGVHRVAGYAGASESITLAAQAGKSYFLEHTVGGTLRSGPQSTSLRQIGERDGRMLVSRSTLL
jgi:hypothetical protein